jgi:peroxidase
LGNPLPKYIGYNPFVNPNTDIFFGKVAYNYGNPSIDTIVTRLDEEFETISEGHILLRDSLFNTDLVTERGIEVYLRGALRQPKLKTSPHYSDDMRNYLPAAMGRDIFSVDIQRARELNIPLYNEARKSFGLPEATEFSDVSSNVKVQEAMRSLYGTVDKLESYVGAMAEEYTTGGCGELMKASIAEQYRRMRDGDPFFYQNPGVLSESDLKALKAMSLGALIKHNTEIEDVPENPFFLVKPPSEAEADVSAIRFSPDLRVSRKVVNQTIQFTIDSYYTGWFSFAFGSTMNDLEIFMFRKIEGLWNADNAFRYLFIVLISIVRITRPLQ